MFDLKKLQQESQEIREQNRKEREEHKMPEKDDVCRLYDSVVNYFNTEGFENELQNDISYVMREGQVNSVNYNINIKVASNPYSCTKCTDINVHIGIDNGSYTNSVSRTLVNQEATIWYEKIDYRKLCKRYNCDYLYCIAYYFVDKCKQLGLSISSNFSDTTLEHFSGVIYI